MEAGAVAFNLKYPTWIESERFGIQPTASLRFGRSLTEDRKVGVVISGHFPVQTSSKRLRPVSFQVSCSSHNFPGT